LAELTLVPPYSGLFSILGRHLHGREVTCLQDCPDKRSEGLGVLLSDTVSTVHSLMPFLDTLLMLITLVAPLTIPSGLLVLLCEQWNVIS
jgi:hypothetical protein